MAQGGTTAARTEEEPLLPVEVTAEAEDHTATCLLYPEDVSQQKAVELYE